MDAPILSSLGPEPWKAPWWKPARGEWSTFLYVMAVHVLAVIGLILYPLPGWPLLLVTLFVLWLCGFGVTVGYHRSIAHKALQLHPVVRHVLIFLAMFSGSGAPMSWTANHRQHHSRVETDEDISSPWIGGFWWAHLRWLWQSGQVPMERWCPDLDQPEYRFWTRVQIPMVALSMFGGLLFGPKVFFWFGPIRLLYAMHAQCFINSSAHMRPGRKDGEDSSQNLIWLGIMQFFQGESWHGNHHAKPAAARFGWRPWQVDFGWYSIVVLERLGLATNVRRPSAIHE